MYVLKEIVDKLEKVGLFEQFKIKRKEPEWPTSNADTQTTTEKVKEPPAQQNLVEETKIEPIAKNPNQLDKHPFAGYNSKLVSLVCSLTYRKE